MTDCSEPEIRDLLPDLVYGNLSSQDAAKIAAHVAHCVECAEELALLKIVHGMRPATNAINIGAIVSRIHAEAAPMRATQDDSSIRSIYSAPSRQHARRIGTWRWAAAVAMIAVGGISVAVARHGGAGMVPIARVDTLLQRDAAQTASVAITTNATDTSKPARRATATASASNMSERAALSVGELSDLSDSELDDVLKKLEAWDGTASSDPLLPVPLVRPTGGTP